MLFHVEGLHLCVTYLRSLYKQIASSGHAQNIFDP